MREIKAKVDASWLMFSGDDDTCLDLCLSGGQGVISVVSHLIPKEISNLISKASNKDDSCLSEFAKYKNLLKYLCIEPNPIPVKWALQKMGIIKTSKVRLPLIEMSEVNSIQMEKALSDLELI